MLTAGKQGDTQGAGDGPRLFGNNQMDYAPILELLHAQLKKVEQAIAMLERLRPENSRSAPERSTRGRKSMGAEERKEVGERIKAYWEKKRQRDPEQ